jgi:hypothetical protein
MVSCPGLAKRDKIPSCPTLLRSHAPENGYNESTVTAPRVKKRAGLSPLYLAVTLVDPSLFFFCVPIQFAAWTVATLSRAHTRAGRLHESRGLLLKRERE